MRPEANAFAMRQGLTLGCMFAVNFIASTIPSITFISWIVEIATLVYAYRSGVKCREEIMDGEMSYGAGLWFTIQLFLYSSMVAGVIRYVYLKWFNTKYLVELGSAMNEVMGELKMMTDVTPDMVREMLTPENMVIYYVAGDVMLGVMVGLVMAFALKRTKE